MKRFHTTRFDCAVLLGIVFSVMLANLSVFGRECAQVRGDVVRLHILANSDSGYDQGLKLRVRDRILAQVGGIFSAQQSQADAKAAAVASLPEIEAAARAALIEAGCEAPVRAEVCSMYFTTRQYDDLSLPAGIYDAVRVTIGTGAGHNWWRVVAQTGMYMCIKQPWRNGRTSRVDNLLSLDTVRDLRAADGCNFAVGDNNCVAL